MPLIASETGGGSRPLPPPGTHAANCVWVIDLGTQHEEFQGKPKILHKVRLTWELSDTRAVFDEAKGEEPFFVSRDYTLSLHEKAALRHDLESWRGAPFSEEQAKGFDVEKLLGKSCLISVIHKKSETSGKVNAKITGVSAIPKGMAVPKLINPTVFYTVDMGNNAIYKKLPEWLQEKIAECDEWKTDESADQGREPSDNDGGGEPF